jgi:uncharacterized SAM-binding protein YcdF (DUF218 family)
VRALRRIFLAIVLIAALAVGIRLAAPFLGHRLIRSDRLAHSDLIVVLGSFQLDRTLEAGMLHRERWAPQIMLLRTPDLVRDRIQKELGIHVPVFVDIQRDALRQMGVPAKAILESPHTQDSTRTEAEAVADYAREHGHKRLIVVTSAYHTGRAGSLFDRAAAKAFQVVVRPTRYEHPDPDHWWGRFPDRTDVVLEYLKTAYGLVPVK